MSLMLRCLLLLLPVALVGCPSSADDDDSTDDDDAVQVDFAFWSSAFDDGGTLPEANECVNPNPELLWEGVPDGTVTLALIFDDPSAGNYPHWAIYNMDPASTGIPAGASGNASCGPDRDGLPDGSEELRNGFGWTGYLGSCACGTATPNDYRWRLWALDTALDLVAGSDFDDLAAAARAAEIEKLEFGHRYGPATKSGCNRNCAR
jgi:Raf kinase inhibitor-like YbhB/YbcL family protein